MSAEIRPYVGPRPFAEADRGLFFGRTAEAQHIVSLIVAHPVVLLYARSGAGKSSLVNAEVIPRLRCLGAEQTDSASDGAEIIGPLRVGGELPDGVDPSSIRNVFAWNALLTLNATAGGPAAASISDALARMQHGSTDLRSPRVVIFDQFEELFTSFEERWRDRGTFLDDLGEALEHDRRLRVVLVMREEFLAGIDTYATRLPERARTRFRLEQLRRDAAMLAVQKPLVGTGRWFAPGAAEKLITQLLQMPARGSEALCEGEFIEPLHLQVVCQNIWESLPSGTQEITEDLISSYGNVDDALARHYERSLAQAVAAGATEGVLRRWFETALITSNESRGIAFRDRRMTAGLDNDLVDVLEHSYLLRSELRGGMTWYELSHDRFVGPILRSNRLWRQKLEHGETTRERLELRAAEWISSGRRTPLLNDAELRELKEWQETPAAKELGISAVLAELAQRSETSASVAETRKLRRQRAVMSGMVVIALAALAVGVVQSRRANEEMRRASAVQARLTTAELAVTRRQQLLQAELMRATDRSARQTYATVASDLVQHEQQFRALALAIRAVANPLSESPESDADVLRTAVRAVGGSLWIPAPPKDVVYNLLSEDGMLAVVLTDEDMVFWNTANDTVAARAKAPPERNFEAGWIVGGNRWVVGRCEPSKAAGGFSGDHDFYFYDSTTGKANDALNKLVREAKSFEVSADGRYVSIQDEDRRLRRIDTHRLGRQDAVKTSEDLLAGAVYHVNDISDDARSSVMVIEREVAPPTASASSMEEVPENDAPEKDASADILIEEILNDPPVSRMPTTAVFVDLTTMQTRPLNYGTRDTRSKEVMLSNDGRTAVIFHNQSDHRIASFWNLADGTSLGPDATVARYAYDILTATQFLCMAESKVTVIDIATGRRQTRALPPGTKFLASKTSGMLLLEYQVPPRHELIAWNPFTGRDTARLTELQSVRDADIDDKGSRFLVTRGDGISRFWDTSRCPRPNGTPVCSARELADPAMDDQLRDRQSLLRVACGQLQSDAADLYATVKELCTGTHRPLTASTMSEQ